jgi:hypothetical protein
VLTQPEPDARLTELRQASRARWGVETLVVGEDAFAFIEIIKRLQEGATVALLVDRPPAPTAVTVNCSAGRSPPPSPPPNSRALPVARLFPDTLCANATAVISRTFCPKLPMTARHRQSRRTHPIDAGNPACVRAGDSAVCHAMVSLRPGLAGGKIAMKIHPLIFVLGIFSRCKIRARLKPILF